MDSVALPNNGLPFTKAHGTGNDFVVIDGVSHDIQLTSADVQAICDRHFGVGADGLIRVAFAVEFNVTDAKYFMDYRNADGSLAETCGNGLRVTARFLVENGYEKPGQFTIGTRAGTVTATVNPDDDEFDNIAIAMGSPRFPQLRAMPVVTTEKGSWNGSGVLMPNPHCVVQVSNTQDAGALLLAPDVAPLSVFPDGANVEFIAGQSASHIDMRTFERGVGETLSCGSGACAAATVWAQQNALDTPWSIQVDVLGGTVFVDASAGVDADLTLTLRGPARVVATGYFQSGNVNKYS